MSRKLVYLNGQNETITFETGPYLIVKIEGLGIPNVDRQEQKAPYQDGSTYIDSLLQNRDIVVELAITKPNDFTNIALYRRELSQRLTPKYGLGDLNYTDEDGNEYTIRAVVSSMVFPNKDYRDPYMRAMVTFTANDPYWRSVTDTTISLPVAVTNSENIINNASSAWPWTIQLTDESYVTVYQKWSSEYVALKTSSDFVTWSAESIVNSAASEYMSIIQLANGNLFLIYARKSDNNLVSRTYTGTWGAEQVINAARVLPTPSVIQLLNGNLYIVYFRYSDNRLVSRTYTSSWGAETLIGTYTGVTPNLLQIPNGDIYLAFNDSTSNTLKYIILSNSIWSIASVIDSVAYCQYPKMLYLSNGSIKIIYSDYSTNYIVTKTLTATLSPRSNILDSGIYTPCLIKMIGYLFGISYIGGSSYLRSVTRSVTPVPAVNTGDVPAPFLVTFQGPSVNPRIINQNTLEYIRLNTTLAAADSFEVDTSFGNKTVILTQGGIVKNGIAFLDIGSTFFQLERGSNTVYYEDDAVLSTATASLEFTERYVGL